MQELILVVYQHVEDRFLVTPVKVVLLPVRTVAKTFAYYRILLVLNLVGNVSKEIVERNVEMAFM